MRGGRTISSVARDLGVPPWSLGRWVQFAKAGTGQRESASLAAETPEQRARRRLEQENDSPRQPRDILEKKRWASCRRRCHPTTSHADRDRVKHEHSIQALAQALEVSPSGFHAHRQKAQGQRRRQDGELRAAIAPIFAASRQTCGCPRRTMALRQQGGRCGKNRVAKVPAPDQPDQVRVAGLPYVDTGEGWLYPAGLLDARTRRLVGWQTGDTLAAELVTQAWQKAVRDRRPAPGLLPPPPSDRGVQDASGARLALLAEPKAAASMESPGQRLR